MIKHGNDQKAFIDISGPAGNAFAIVGAATTYAKQLGYDKAKIKALSADMMSGDYEHLLQVFDEHFGEYVDLIR